MCRRRPGEEREYKKEWSTSRQQRSRDPGHDKDSARQRLGNRWLNDQVSGVAKRTIGLNRWAIRVRVHDLHDPTENNKCTAYKAEHYPQQVA